MRSRWVHFLALAPRLESKSMGAQDLWSLIWPHYNNRNYSECASSKLALVFHLLGLVKNEWEIRVQHYFLVLPFKASCKSKVRYCMILSQLRCGKFCHPSTERRVYCHYSNRAICVANYQRSVHVKML